MLAGSQMPSRTIAVIGGGISGLAAGYVLSRSDRVTLFEADARPWRPRGHASRGIARRPGSRGHRVHRLQRADLSVADPAVRRA